MPSYPTLPVIATDAMCDKLSAALTVPDPNRFESVFGLIGRLVVGFLEVGAKFHQRAGRKGVVP